MNRNNKMPTRTALIGFLFCSLLLAQMTSVKAQSVVVPSFRVDNAAAGVEAGSPAVQSLFNGNFVVVWVDGRIDYRIYSSIYNNAGTLIRSNYRIDDGIPGSWSCCTGSGDLAVDSNGNFFVAWLNSPDLTNEYGRIRKFLPNGNPAGASVSTRESGQTYSQVIKVARGKNDKIIVSYGAGSGIYYRFFDNNLSPLTLSIQVNQTEPYSSPALASDSLGNFVVSWSQNDGAGLDGRMRARLYDPDGNPRTNEFPIEPMPQSGGDHPVAVYNRQGNFIVVWWAALEWGVGRVFDGAGNPLTDVIYFGPAVPGANANFWQPPSVDADDAGNFIVVYPYRDDNIPLGDVYGTILGPNGQIINQFFQIGDRHAQYDVDVACLSGGQFVTAWRDQQDDTNGDIYANILQNNSYMPLRDDPIPAAGPMALAALAGLLGWALRRKISFQGRREGV